MKMHLIDWVCVVALVVGVLGVVISLLAYAQVYNELKELGHENKH